MNLLYISLAEVLVFSDASVFSENIVNMKKMEKCIVAIDEFQQISYYPEKNMEAI